VKFAGFHRKYGSIEQPKKQKMKDRKKKRKARIQPFRRNRCIEGRTEIPDLPEQSTDV
jgi:hypothetical protein